MLPLATAQCIVSTLQQGKPNKSTPREKQSTVWPRLRMEGLSLC